MLLPYSIEDYIFLAACLWKDLNKVLSERSRSLFLWYSALNLSWRRSLLYWSQSIDLHSKSMVWFLYDRNLCQSWKASLKNLGSSLGKEKLFANYRGDNLSFHRKNIAPSGIKALHTYKIVVLTWRKVIF